VGDPLNAVKIFNEKEIDEIVVLDIDASAEKRGPDLLKVQEIAGEAFIPLAYGGGITTIEEIKNLCTEAQEYGFFAVCIPPPLVKNTKSLLKDSPVKVATVIGFPFGYSNAKAKFMEVQQAIDDGADELDVVINLIALKSKAWQYLEK